MRRLVEWTLGVATGHAFHWRRLAQNGTRGLPNGWGRIQTGLFGVARF